MSTVTNLATYEVICGNPFFKGTVEGVQFVQATGGARGTATRDQAEAIIGTQQNFRCPQLEAEFEEDDAPAAAPLTSIRGIGTAMEEKLVAAGIVSIADLAAADAAELAAAAGVPVPSVNGWIQSAKKVLS